MKAVIFLIWCLIFPAPLFAQNDVPFEDKAIATTFKTLAKGFVLAADIEKVKKDNISRLSRMNEAKFCKRYAKVYASIKDLPVAMRSAYGLTENASRQECIKNISLLNKDKLYAVIEAIPDEFIARNFKQYLREMKEDVKNSSLVSRIRLFWENIAKKSTLK